MQENTMKTEPDNIKEISTPKDNSTMVNRFIKGYIIFMAAMNAIATVMLFNTYRDLTTHSDPTLPHWPFLLMSIFGLGALAALYGLWNNKRWGFITYLGITFVSMLITFFVLDTPPSPASLVGLALFLGVFASRFKQMN